MAKRVDHRFPPNTVDFVQSHRIQRLRLTFRGHRDLDFASVRNLIAGVGQGLRQVAGFVEGCDAS